MADVVTYGRTCQLCECLKMGMEFTPEKEFCNTCEFAIRMPISIRSKIKRATGSIHQTPTRKAYIAAIKQQRKRYVW